MKHPNSLMLLRIAQGDAFGMATEYIELPRDQHVKDEALKFERYVKHPKWNIPAGHYTDDTQMSIAVAKTLILHDFELPKTDSSSSDEERANEWEKLVELRRAFATHFVRTFKRDPRYGYSKYFQKFLESINTRRGEWADGDEFLIRCNPNSDKNGAAMRSVPIGVLPDPKLVLHVAREQAKITHDTDGGRRASEMVALMSHFALYHDAPLPDVRKFLASVMLLPALATSEARWPDRPVEGPRVGFKTAHAVMTLLSEEKTLEDIAKRAIRWGGDTDTVISIAWGIASARMHEPLPAFLDEDLERDTHGRDFLMVIGDKLMERYA